METPDLSKMTVSERKAYMNRIDDSLKKNISSERYEKLMQEIEATQIKYVTDDEMRQSQKYIDERNEKINKKERRKADKEFERSSKDKPSFLVSFAGILEKVLHNVVTLYSMAGLINALFIWQIYKVVSAAGWQGIFQTKYTLYVVLYFVLLFILKKVYYYLYKYANT